MDTPVPRSSAYADFPHSLELSQIEQLPPAPKILGALFFSLNQLLANASSRGSDSPCNKPILISGCNLGHRTSCFIPCSYCESCCPASRRHSKILRPYKSLMSLSQHQCTKMIVRCSSSFSTRRQRSHFAQTHLPIVQGSSTLRYYYFPLYSPAPLPLTISSCPQKPAGHFDNFVSPVLQ